MNKGKTVLKLPPLSLPNKMGPHNWDEGGTPSIINCMEEQQAKVERGWRLRGLLRRSDTVTFPAEIHYSTHLFWSNRLITPHLCARRYVGLLSKQHRLVITSSDYAQYRKANVNVGNLWTGFAKMSAANWWLLLLPHHTQEPRSKAGIGDGCMDDLVMMPSMKNRSTPVVLCNRWGSYSINVRLEKKEQHKWHRQLFHVTVWLRIQTIFFNWF